MVSAQTWSPLSEEHTLLAPKLHLSSTRSKSMILPAVGLAGYPGCESPDSQGAKNLLSGPIPTNWELGDVVVR